eukprot:2238531-Alexandrium_andersonii.AAC.1
MGARCHQFGGWLVFRDPGTCTIGSRAPMASRWTPTRYGWTFRSTSTAPLSPVPFQFCRSG